MALPQLFLPTQMLIVVEYRSIPKLILLSRMLQQLLHLTKSYFPEEVGVEKFTVKIKKEVENNFSRESDWRTSC